MRSTFKVLFYVKKCRTNTVWGYMIVLKHIVSIARNDGRLPFNPFAGYINSPESVDRGYLTEKEIQTLMDAPMKNTHHELVRDLFVFSVFTGLAYTDMKIGSNQVRAIRINVSATPEDMDRIEREGCLDEWCADNLKFFADTFGKENIMAAHLHRDEKTPHMHVTLVPIVKGERNRGKREEQAKKRYRKKPADTVRLCADDLMTRLKLKSFQDTYAVAMAKYGLRRGIDGSEARHVYTQQYYRDLKKLSDGLKTEVADLQQRKETAREELVRAKDTEYKREISRLTVLLNKTLKWFPQIKDMIDIERLCLAVGFNKEQTATLLTGKPVEYSGELYSMEHKRKFMAKDVKAKIFSDGGKFILTIGLRPIGEWFGEQFEKLRQGMRRPVQPQTKGKGMKL